MEIESYIINCQLFLYIHITSTGSATFIPALLPTCANLYEVGIYTKDEENVNRFLVASQCGLIKIDNDKSEVEVHAFSDNNFSIEVKTAILIQKIYRFITSSDGTFFKYSLIWTECVYNLCALSSL